MSSLRYSALLPLLSVACGGTVAPGAPGRGSASTSTEMSVGTATAARPAPESATHASGPPPVTSPSSAIPTAATSDASATIATSATTSATTPASSFSSLSLASSSSVSFSTVPTSPTPSQPVFAGDTYVSGGIATDGETVLWIQEGPSGVGEVVSCPVTGCTTPSVFWSSAGWGGEESLLVAAGRAYFQAGTDASGAGPILSCPVAGCGAGPSTYVADVTDNQFGPALATDGENLFWVSNLSVYACPLGAACASPSVRATLGPKAAVSALAVSDATIHWVDETTWRIQSVPVGGGSVSTHCTVPGGSPYTAGPGDLAVVDGFAYVSGITGSSDSVGIYRCAVGDGQAGAATEYAHDLPTADILTDGTSLLWMNTAFGAGAETYGVIRTCVAGVTCSAGNDIGAPISTGNHGAGFTIFGRYVYSAGVAILRTAY